ncbi:MAG: phosphate signaling complex protein PhoU [Deltaproteobacteria bacterium]|jgi:phosphate transport system protein|nr:phosphate signaling complex protein PhoU [Deltaproteobacteria bacterium]MBW2483737.1 phosphate signaling complex protein PhoU [Deltaproteobacteria bacterium]
MQKHLQKDIDSLKDKIITMGSEAEDRVYKASLALINRDERLVDDVIQSDRQIDKMEVDIEEHCLKILALYQPVAIDLRFIIAVLKINNELERVGDIAVNIAERAAFLSKYKDFEIPYDVKGMATIVESMLTRSIDALVHMDVQLAHKIRAEDDSVDEYNREMYSRVKDMLIKSPEDINCMLHAVSAGRHLERIADHACNIAEDVIYLVDAEIVRHTPEVFEE